MNLKKMVCVGLLIVSCSMRADLNDETFGLSNAVINLDTEKVKEILAAKGNEISRENYHKVIGQMRNKGQDREKNREISRLIAEKMRGAR